MWLNSNRNTGISIEESLNGGKGGVSQALYSETGVNLHEVLQGECIEETEEERRQQR